MWLSTYAAELLTSCLDSPTQVKIDRSKRARYIDGPVTGSEPVITGPLWAHYNGPVMGPLRVRYRPVTSLLRTRINNKNNGTVTGFQAVKCWYNEGSKNRPVWTRVGNRPVMGLYGPRELLPVYDILDENLSGHNISRYQHPDNTPLVYKAIEWLTYLCWYLGPVVFNLVFFITSQDSICKNTEDLLR